MCIKGMWNGFLFLQIVLSFERSLRSPRLCKFYMGGKRAGTPTEQCPGVLCSGSPLWVHLQLSLTPDKAPGAPGHPPAPVIPLLPLRWEASSPGRVVLKSSYTCRQFCFQQNGLFSPQQSQHFGSKSRFREKIGGKIKSYMPPLWPCLGQQVHHHGWIWDSASYMDATWRGPSEWLVDKSRTPLVPLGSHQHPSIQLGELNSSTETRLSHIPHCCREGQRHKVLYEHRETQWFCARPCAGAESCIPLC